MYTDVVGHHNWHALHRALPGSLWNNCIRVLRRHLYNCICIMVWRRKARRWKSCPVLPAPSGMIWNRKTGFTRFNAASTQSSSIGLQTRIFPPKGLNRSEMQLIHSTMGISESQQNLLYQKSRLYRPVTITYKNSWLKSSGAAVTSLWHVRFLVEVLTVIRAFFIALVQL